MSCRYPVIAFALALLLLTGPVAAQVAPSVGLTLDKQACEGSDHLDRLIDTVWPRIFGKSVEARPSTLLLDGEPGSSIWTVQLFEGAELKAETLFMETQRFEAGAAVDQLLAQTAGFAVQRSVVAGKVVAATGEELAVYAVVAEFGEGEAAGRVFVPVSLPKSIGEAEGLAATLADAYRAVPAVDDWLQPAIGVLPLGSKSGIPCHMCDRIYNRTVRNCNIIEGACLAGVFAVTAACIVACGATGPGVPFCVAACIAAGVAAEVVCLATGDQCRFDAEVARWDCESSCHGGGFPIP